MITACTATPVPVPEPIVSLTQRPSSPWPESRIRVVITPAKNNWVVSVGNNTLGVIDEDKKKAEHDIPLTDTTSWSDQINLWRVHRLNGQTYSLRQFSGIKQANSPTVLVWVSPDCLLCERWKTSWPIQVPVTWIPVASTPPSSTWLQAWCPSGSLESMASLSDHAPTVSQDQEHTKACLNILKHQYKQAKRLGVVVFPTLMHPEGELLSGWPDAAWLARWVSPRQPPLPPALPVEDMDL